MSCKRNTPEQIIGMLREADDLPPFTSLTQNLIHHRIDPDH